MPISRETEIRSQERRNTPIIYPETQQAQFVSDPAPLAAATNTVPQQQGASLHSFYYYEFNIVREQVLQPKQTLSRRHTNTRNIGA